MKTLVHYDHIRKEIIVESLADTDSPLLKLRFGTKKDHKEEPDPYWHAVDGNWTVNDTREYDDSPGAHGA